MISDRCCGNCMYHVPCKKNQKIRSGFYRNPIKYWKCKFSNRTTKNDHVCGCGKFENRYKPKDRGEEWVTSLYAKEENGRDRNTQEKDK